MPVVICSFINLKQTMMDQFRVYKAVLTTIQQTNTNPLKVSSSYNKLSRWSKTTIVLQQYCAPPALRQIVPIIILWHNSRLFAARAPHTTFLIEDRIKRTTHRLSFALYPSRSLIFKVISYNSHTFWWSSFKTRTLLQHF